MKPISEQIKLLIEQNVLKEGEESSQHLNQLIGQTGSSSSSDYSDDDEDEESDAVYEDARSEARREEEESSDDDEPEDEDHMFKHEVKSVVSWMTQLSPCQQMVSVLSMMSTLSQSQNLFVSNHLQFQLKNNQSSELKKDVSNANSLSYWQSFLSENLTPKTTMMLDLLLEKIPLVSPVDNSSNSPLSLMYLHLVTSTLNKVTKSSTPSDKTTLAKCRELLSLSLICSIFSPEQKKTFLSPYTSKLMVQSNESSYIESTIRSSQNRNSNPISSPGDATSSNRSSVIGNSTASSSLLKPFTGEGMSGVPGYLKGLRLHKYTPLFASLPSLNHFLNLTDDQLESLGVAAKGARKKFVQSLSKLKERPSQLKSLLNSSPSDILLGVSEVISTPLSKESPEVNLVLQLLLKVKNEMKAEHEKEFQEVIAKSLQQPIWSREQMRLLIQVKESPILESGSPSTSSSIPRSSSANIQASLSSGHSSLASQETSSSSSSKTSSVITSKQTSSSSTLSSSITDGKAA